MSPAMPHFQKGTFEGDMKKSYSMFTGLFQWTAIKIGDTKGTLRPCFCKPLVCFRPWFRTARAARTERYEMKKQSKPKAAADKQAAAKPKRMKTKAGNFKFSVGGIVCEVSETATEREFLKAIVIGTIKISEQVEALRRTLWRIGEIREYDGKSAKTAAKDTPNADAAKGGKE